MDVCFQPLTRYTSDSFGLKMVLQNIIDVLNTRTHTQDNIHTNHRMDTLQNRNEITARTIQSNIKR